MGCPESKDSAPISPKGAQEKLFEATGRILSPSSSSASSGMGSSASTSSAKGSKPSSASGKEDELPHSAAGKEDESPPSSPEYMNIEEELRNDVCGYLDNIPSSDLGESLDARRMRPVWSRHSEAFASTSNHGRSISASSSGPRSSMSLSAKSVESGDSGVYELDDIITENSLPELVHKIEREFTPVENLDLTITGKACPRLLSGSQRVRQQEDEIMENLRQEGFISTSKHRATGGLAFEVTEATPEAESAGGKIKPMNFLPRKHKEHLDKQIDKFHLRDLTSADVARRQFLAEERRRLEMEAKLEKLTVVTSKSNIDEKVEQLRKKKDEKLDTALEKREAHLKELRDKLKAQNQKAKQVKLKKLINGPPVPVPFKPGASRFTVDDDNFFN